jgi:hypothetical protein
MLVFSLPLYNKYRRLPVENSIYPSRVAGCKYFFLIFSTMIHKFAQTFLAILIDAAKREDYLAHRLNRKHKDFTVQAKSREGLTANALLD